MPHFFADLPVIWYLMIPVLAAYGAWARRFMGGASGKNQRGLELLAVAAPTALVAFVASGSHGLAMALLGGLFSLGLTMLVASTGDGDQTDLGEWTGAEPDKPFWGFANGSLGTPGYMRDFIGLAISGFGQTLVAGAIVIVSGHWPAGILLMLSGTFKAPAYALGYVIPSTRKNLMQGRELGEAIWGATIGASAAVALAAL